MSANSRFANRLLGFLGVFLLALLVLACCGYFYLKYGHPPVATADPPFPMEAQIVHLPMKARITRELQRAPFAPSEQVYENGARIYKKECVSCHGLPDHDVAFAKYMYPGAPQLWLKHKNGVVGVSDDEAGETFWKVRNGIRLSGMPAYQKVLSETEMWQVSLLLKNADQILPSSVREILQPPPSQAASR